MTSRTRKLAVIAVVVVVTMVAVLLGREPRPPLTGPPLAVKFMRYGTNGTAVIQVTNHSEFQIEYRYSGPGSTGSISPHTVHEVTFLLLSGMLGEMPAPVPPPRLLYRQKRLDLRSRINSLLARIGIGTARPLTYSEIKIQLPAAPPQNPPLP